MEIFIAIITNVGFLGIFTLIVTQLFKRGLQKQKSIFESDLERLKTELQLEFSNKQELLNKKRDVYINLIESMTLFIGNRIPESEQKAYQKKFLQAYDIAWLWASDEVLKAMSDFMQFKITHASGTLPPELQSTAKKLFIECVLALRKDIGFSTTNLTYEDYKFIFF